MTLNVPSWNPVTGEIVKLAKPARLAMFVPPLLTSADAFHSAMSRVPFGLAGEAQRAARESTTSPALDHHAGRSEAEGAGGDRTASSSPRVGER